MKYLYTVYAMFMVLFFRRYAPLLRIKDESLECVALTFFGTYSRKGYLKLRDQIGAYALRMLTYKYMKSGDLDAIRDMTETLDNSIPKQYVDYVKYLAITYDQPSILEILIEKGWSTVSKTLDPTFRSAILMQKIECVEWFLAHGVERENNFNWAYQTAKNLKNEDMMKLFQPLFETKKELA